MSNSEEDRLPKHPVWRQLTIDLKRLPEYLEEKARKRKERKEFVRKVWEKACIDAGFIKPGEK